MLLEQGSRELNQAISLDDALAPQISRPWIYEPSRCFVRHVAPLLELSRGEASMRLAADIRHMLDQFKGDQIKSTVVQKALRMTIEHYIANSTLEPVLKRSLVEAIDWLHQAEASRVVGSEQVRRELQTIAERCGNYAYQCFEQAARVKEISETQQRLCSFQHEAGWYRFALNTLCPDAALPLMGTLAAPALYKLLDTAPYRIDTLSLEPDESTGEQTVCLTEDGENYPIARFHGLSPDMIIHLKRELQRAELHVQLNSPLVPLTPAYGVLLTPIPVAPLVTSWQTILITMQPWLILALAYLPVSPIPPAAAPALDPAPAHVITCVEISWELVQRQFQASIYPQDVEWAKLA
jgi:hypothetical protein